MSENNRRWFRIHLSTAVMLMFVAGAILGVNCLVVIGTFNDEDQATVNYVVQSAQAVGGDNRSHTFATWTQGWPFWFRGRMVDENGEVMKHPWGNSWRIERLAADALIAFAICGMIAVILEWLIRRREASKP